MTFAQHCSLLLRGSALPEAAPAPRAALMKATREERLTGVLLHAMSESAHDLPAWAKDWRIDLQAHATRLALLDGYRALYDKKVMSAAGAHGDVIAFKGGALAHLLYAQSFQRERLDLDLWLPKDAFSPKRIASMFFEMGYERQTHLPSPRRSRASTFVRTYQNDFVHSVDVHHHLVKHALLTASVNEDEVRQRTQDFGEFRTLSFEDALWMCALHRHASPNKRPRLLGLVEFHRLLQHSDLEKARAIASRFKVRSLLEATLEESGQFMQMKPHAVSASDRSAFYLRVPEALYPWGEIFLSERPLQEAWAHLYPSGDYLRERLAISQDTGRFRMALARLANL